MYQKIADNMLGCIIDVKNSVNITVPVANAVEHTYCYLRQVLSSFGSLLSATNEALSGDANLGDIGRLTDETMKMATITVSVIPILLVYPWLQKYYVKGVMIGSVKG